MSPYLYRRENSKKTEIYVCLYMYMYVQYIHTHAHSICVALDSVPTLPLGLACLNPILCNGEDREELGQRWFQDLQGREGRSLLLHLEMTSEAGVREGW